MRTLLVLLLALLGVTEASAATALAWQTPGVQAIESRMQMRHAQLRPYYDNGAVGLSVDGMIELHDPGSVPLAARQTVNALIAAENRDRAALYAEIANANAHPEWQSEVQRVFARRWVAHARQGWWLRSDTGWRQK